MIAACAQFDAKTINEADSVWPQMQRAAAQAAERRADLIVFPEAAYPAYWLESKDRYRSPDLERSKAVLARLAGLAGRHRIWLIAGFVEESGETLYNSAAVFDRKGGLVGIARKHFLWDCDHRWFSPGDRLTVLPTEFGPVGIMICADARMPEIPATLVARGARLIVEPTAWVNTSRSPNRRLNIQPEFLIESRAREFGVPILCASKSGREGQVLEYVGLSRIVDHEGAILASAGPEGDALVIAEVDSPHCGEIQIDGRALDRLLSTKPPYHPRSPARRVRVFVRQSANGIATSLVAADARADQVNASDLESFAPARCMALDGAQALVVHGAGTVRAATVRTRAAENRLFIFACGQEQAAWIVDPDGNVLWAAADPSDDVEIDLAEADRKQFTPTTDIWGQRRVEYYQFARASAPPGRSPSETIAPPA